MDIYIYTYKILCIKHILSKAEKNYPAHKLEFLALKWSVYDKFNDYLLRHRFTVLTDNNPLTYVLSSAKLDATGQRWVAALAAFDFDVLYRPGNQNADADSLSRLPGVKESISLEAVSAICNIIHAQPHIYSLSTSDELKEPQVPQVKIDVKEIQENDLIIQEWKHNIEKKRKPHRATLHYKPAHRWFHDNYDKFEIKDGVLFRNAIISGNTRQQIVLPLSQDTTGYSPYYIMFGREPRLPIDLIYDTATKEVPQSHNKYIKTLHEAIEKSYEKINKSVNDAQAKQKKRYDTKARSATLDIGDRVMVKIVVFDGKHKIADKWEEDFYRIPSQPNVNIPVYTVEKRRWDRKKTNTPQKSTIPDLTNRWRK